MALTKTEKQQMLKDVETAVRNSKAIVFVNFKGLTVGNTTEMRRNLRANKVGYMVAKKTITKKALEGGNIKGSLPTLDGELAIAFSEDLTAPAREIYAAQKKYDKKVTILGGVFDGEYKSKEEMLSIALIPSREVLLSQLAYLLKSPMQRLAIAVNEVSKKKS